MRPSYIEGQKFIFTWNIIRVLNRPMWKIGVDH